MNEVINGRLSKEEIRVQTLNGACKRAGADHIRVHGLRHTFSLQMVMAGSVVSERSIRPTKHNGRPEGSAL